MPTKSQKVQQELMKSTYTHQAMLAHACLDEFPLKLFASPSESLALLLTRLDLSYNNLTELPPQISQLTGLKQFWLSNNPLVCLPSGGIMDQLVCLEVLDIKSTRIEELPAEISTLPKLYSIDWRDTPLAVALLEQHDIAVNDLPAVQEVLFDKYTRRNLEIQLLEILTGAHFAQEMTVPNINQRIKDLVVVLSDMYDQLDDFKFFVRRADNLLPVKIDECTMANLQTTKENFFQLQRDVLRQRLSADVEIKLRGIYYDRAERALIDQMLQGIYESVKTLEDIQFLVKYASQVMPNEPQSVTGPIVWANILDLQGQLIAKREAAITTLQTAMSQMYPEQRPENLEAKAREVAAVFQRERFATKSELVKLSQLSGEVSKLFPPDFASVQAFEVFSAWQAMFVKKRVTTA